MKKGINKAVILGVLFASALLVCLGVIISLMAMSNHLREFKVDMFVLCNEADICVADGPEGQFRISKDNLTALNALVASTRGDFTVGNPAIEEQFSMSFDHNDEKWDLTVGKAGDNKLMLDLEGPRKYKLYIKENNKYQDMLRCVSAKGYHTANKPINISK